MAIPAAAAAESVPASTPADGLDPMPIVTLLVAVPTRLPEPSTTRTCTAGVIDAPEATLVGCTEEREAGRRDRRRA